jgi:hypothetical protein
MARAILLVLLLQMAWATGFPQSLSLSRLGDAFQRTNLDVRWEAPTNALPRTVWIYRLLPKTFPPAAVSNLAMECGFTEKDRKISTADQTIYKDADKFPSKQLIVSRGSIFYNAVSHYGPKNLATNVPEMAQMPSLTTNFLLQFGVELSDIEKNADGAPNFHYWEPFKEYFMPDGIVTNIEFRAVSFSRAVDGATVIGAGTAGDGEIYFGPNGKPAHADLSWRDLQRVKSCPTVTPETIVQRIRYGRAVQGGIPMNLPPIDWATVKSLTVKKADLCYYAGDRLAPSAWLMPLLSLWTTVDTGNGNIDVEIDCPIIDETKP